MYNINLTFSKLLYFSHFRSFCAVHRPIQRVDPSLIKIAEDDNDASTCVICYEEVLNKVTNDTLWAPCCKKRWFHRDCLQVSKNNLMMVILLLFNVFIQICVSYFFLQRQALAQGYFFKCPMCNEKDKFNKEMKTFGIYIPEM